MIEMAITTVEFEHKSNLLNALAAPFKVLGQVFVNIAECSSINREITFLSGLSDEQLAERDLTREDIVLHVVRGHGFY